MKKNSNTVLTIVLIAMLLLFALFGGSATLVTLNNNWMMGFGWSSVISWMWIPALLFLTMALMLSWVLKTSKKKLIENSSQHKT